MAKLATAVFVRDPDSHRTVVLQPGEEPEPRLAALVTAPDAWEDGKLPDLNDSETAGTAGTAGTDGSEDSAKAAPAAKKTAATKRAATKPARGRDAADEGSSGE